MNLARLAVVFRCLAAIACLYFLPAHALAAGSNVYFHQTYMEDVLAPPDYDIKDVKTVFRMVFSSLPDSVKVYPTEGYYYFYFYYKGIKYAGNFRLDIADKANSY